MLESTDFTTEEAVIALVVPFFSGAVWRLFWMDDSPSRSLSPKPVAYFEIVGDFFFSRPIFPPVQRNETRAPHPRIRRPRWPAARKLSDS